MAGCFRFPLPRKCIGRRKRETGAGSEDEISWLVADAPAGGIGCLRVLALPQPAAVLAGGRTADQRPMPVVSAEA